jgi:hypothetical protein
MLTYASYRSNDLPASSVEVRIGTSMPLPAALTSLRADGMVIQGEVS